MSIGFDLALFLSCSETDRNTLSCRLLEFGLPGIHPD